MKRWCSHCGLHFPRDRFGPGLVEPKRALYTGHGIKSYKHLKTEGGCGLITEWPTKKVTPRRVRVVVN